MTDEQHPVGTADRIRELEEALRAADKRLCELTPNFPPDVGPDMQDAPEIEETGAVVMQIRAALKGGSR
jgi:hypothetical protein